LISYNRKRFLSSISFLSIFLFFRCFAFVLFPGKMPGTIGSGQKFTHLFFLRSIPGS